MQVRLLNRLMALTPAMSFPNRGDNGDLEITAGKPSTRANRSPIAPRRAGIADEQIFLQSELVTVTVSRVIVGPKTYAMSGILAVESFVGPRNLLAKVLAPVTGGMLIALLLISMPEDRPVDELFFAAVSIATVGAFSWALLRWIRGSRMWRYGLAIETASGRDVICTSPDASFIDRVFSAINEAIVARG